MNKLLYILLALSLTSCFRDRIELDLNEENQKIVITSWITDLEEPQFVTVGKTVNYLGPVSQSFVSAAIVKLSNSTDEYFLEEGTEGRYYLPSDWTAALGETYTLSVIVGEEEFVASHIMRPCPEIEDYNTLIYEEDDFGEEETMDSVNIYGTIFSFQETPGDDDAYYAVDYLKGTMAGDSMRNGGFANDDFADGEYFAEIELSEYDRLFAVGDTAILELFSIGDETANYLADIESEIYRGLPFDPPPANVRTNFTGGAIGYFIISGAKQVEIIVEE